MLQYPQAIQEVNAFDHYNWLSKAEMFILQSLNDNSGFVMADLAKALFVSERQLYRIIKNETGRTPNEYVRLVKLQTAKKLLESERVHTVAEVSLAVGFNRSDYFSKLYSKQFGIRPIEYLNSRK